MQVTLENTGNLERRMTVVLDAAPIEEAFEQKLRDAARNVRLNGFRPGKTPLKEVRRRFGPSLRMDAAMESMESGFREALNRESLDLAGTPQFDVEAPRPNQPLTFTATFEVLPEIELGDLSQIRIERDEATVTDADVDAMIEKLRHDRRDWQPVERAAKEEDRVTFDLIPRGEERFDGAGLALVVGRPFVMPGVAEAAAGMAAGEAKRVQSEFPQFVADEALRGKAGEFDLTVKEVAEGIVPPLDEAFFAALGITEGGEERFRQEVRDDLESRLAAAIRGAARRQAVEALVNLHDFDAPKVLVEREAAAVRQRFPWLAEAGEEGASERAAAINRQAERRVRASLLVNAIVERQGLMADAAKVRTRIEEIARGFEHPEEVVNAYYSDDDLLAQLESATLEEQVVEHVLSVADVQTVTRSYREVMGGGPGTAPEAAAADALNPEPETPENPQSP